MTPAPCGSRWRKPSDEITDRAARYRAAHPDCRPFGPHVCAFCGATENVEVHHVNGEESDTSTENLAWSCRSCNAAIGVVLKRAGLGRRTRQFNPKATGASTLSQWVTAVLSMKGESDAMEPAAAVDMIRATPPARRSAFAQQIWRIRREHGTDRRS